MKSIYNMKSFKVLKAIPALTLALMVSCAGAKKEDTETAIEEKVKVKVERVSVQDVDQVREFTATVEANITNQIAPQTPVRINKLFAEVGDHVRAGQVLVKMDENSLAQARIQLENMETEFRRIDELYKIGGASKSAWEAQKTALEVSRTALDNLIENTQLLSPVSGIVTARNYDNGDLYNGQTPIFVVEQIQPVKLIVNVSESFFKYVKKGNEVDIKLDVYGDEVFKGKVNLVYPTIDPNTRTFQIEIHIANKDERVRPGMFARVTLNFGTQRHVVAPDQAIIKQSGSGERFIYVYENGKVVFKKVELGRRMGNKYEIISGVNDGDVVIMTAHNRLRNGTEVEIEN